MVLLFVRLFSVILWCGKHIIGFKNQNGGGINTGNGGKNRKTRDRVPSTFWISSIYFGSVRPQRRPSPTELYICRHSAYPQSEPQPTTGVAKLAVAQGAELHRRLTDFRVSQSVRHHLPWLGFTWFYSVIQANSRQATRDFCWTRGTGTDLLSVLGDFPLPISFDHNHIHPFISVYVCGSTLLRS
jgi:hypothetical protein